MVEERGGSEKRRDPVFDMMAAEFGDRVDAETSATDVHLHLRDLTAEIEAQDWESVVGRALSIALAAERVRMYVRRTGARFRIHRDKDGRPIRVDVERRRGTAAGGSTAQDVRR